MKARTFSHFSRLVALLVAVLHVLDAGPTAASSQPAQSLEWQVADSDLIVRGIVLRVEDAPPQAGPGYQRATIQVLETIKGTPHHELTFIDVGIRYVQEHQGHEMLLFLVRSDGPRPYYSLLPRYHRRNQMSEYVLREYDFLSAFPLQKERPRPFFTMDWRVLHDREELLTALRHAVADERGHVLIKPCQIGGPRYHAHRPPSIFTLIVPIDHRLEERARQWTRLPQAADRAGGATALAHFPSEENAAILRALLSDCSFGEAERQTPWSRDYYVRRAAYESLSKMGFGVAPPIMFEPGQAYRSLWPVLIVIGCAVFGVGMWVSRRFWRGRNGQAPPARQIWLAGAVGCGLAAICFVALDWRSRSTTDDAFLMLGDSAHQFTSLPGRLRYAVVFDWRTPAPPTVASLPVRQGVNWKNPMYDSYPQVSWAWERWGLGYLDVNVAEPHQSRQRHRCRAVVIPLWFVATLFGGLTCVMLPLWRRSLRRVREGLCANCGYDLRASAERCPECGRAIILPVCRSP